MQGRNTSLLVVEAEDGWRMEERKLERLKLMSVGSEAMLDYVRQCIPVYLNSFKVYITSCCCICL
jgi:hypothetical protein